MATIATHNGSKVCREHNVRNAKVTAKESHINPDGVHEVWHDEKIRKAYDRLFGEAQAAYNAKQEREERKIKSYYNKIRNDSKKHLAYEMIVGVYGKDCDHKTGKEILKEFADGWKERNPNLELIGAYYHADEQGDPHIHIDYIPVAHGYRNGMETQTGLVKALGEMGFEKTGKETAQIQWERRENKYLEQLCINRRIVVERPAEAKKEHLHTEEYKATQEVINVNKAAERATEALKKIEKEIKEAQEQLQPIRAEYEAKKEYIAGMEKDFNLINGVQEKKSLTGKVKFYEVPAKVWETQAITQMDRNAQEAAERRWNELITDYQETKVENRILKAEHAKMSNVIERVNETLQNVSKNVREAFLEFFKSSQEKNTSHEEKTLKTQNRDFDDVER